MFENILIAYDGSKESHRALDSAISLARCLQAQLKIVTVVEALPGYTNLAALVVSDLPRELMEQRCARLKQLQAAAQLLIETRSGLVSQILYFSRAAICLSI